MPAISPALAGEEYRIAEIWHEAWHGAHKSIVDPDLAEARTFGSFQRRLNPLMNDVLVARVKGEIAGFSIVRFNEIFQFFVSSSHWGTGVAQELIKATEQLLAARGVGVASLTCVAGNDRAIAFYIKSGWAIFEEKIERLESELGEFEVPSVKFRKQLL